MSSVPITIESQRPRFVMIMQEGREWVRNENDDHVAFALLSHQISALETMWFLRSQVDNARS